jgi:hypothetical protein
LNRRYSVFIEGTHGSRCHLFFSNGRPNGNITDSLINYMKRLHNLHTKDAPHRYCNRKDREECIHIVLFPFGRSIQVCEDFFFFQPCQLLLRFLNIMTCRFKQKYVSSSSSINVIVILSNVTFDCHRIKSTR